MNWFDEIQRVTRSYWAIKGLSHVIVSDDTRPKPAPCASNEEHYGTDSEDHCTASADSAASAGRLDHGAAKARLDFDIKAYRATLEEGRREQELGDKSN